MSRTPEGVNLLLLIPGGKGPKFDPQPDELFEMRGDRLITAEFPGAHGAPGDPKLLGQTRLRQTHPCAQR